MKAIITTIEEEFQKARVKGFLRTRSGHLERVKEFERRGGEGGPGEEGTEKPKRIKEFKWKKHGKYGGSTVKFRFMDESRGERFFDTMFSVGYGAKPGEIKIQSTIRGHEYGSEAAETGIKEALKPGTIVNLDAGWIGPRGHSHDGSFRARIDKVTEVDPSEGSGYRIKYTQIKD